MSKHSCVIIIFGISHSFAETLLPPSSVQLNNVSHETGGAALFCAFCPLRHVPPGCVCVCAVDCLCVENGDIVFSFGKFFPLQVEKKKVF